MAWIFLRESKTMPQLTERMMMKKLRRGLACLAAAALGVTALSPLGVSAPEQPGMYVAQETDDSITYAYNRTNSDYDYLTLNQNKFYTWDVRDTNYYTVVLEDGTSLSAADMPENVSLLAENAGKVITYESIIKDIWGPHADTNNRILRVNMANIRRKIEKNPAVPKYVFTEVGVGYRMLENELNS